MPPRRFDPSEIKVNVEQTYIDQDTGSFLSDGEVVFSVDPRDTMTMPFKGAKDREEAISQAAKALETKTTNFKKIAERLLYD